MWKSNSRKGLYQEDSLGRLPAHPFGACGPSPLTKIVVVHHSVGCPKPGPLLCKVVSKFEKCGVFFQHVYNLHLHFVAQGLALWSRTRQCDERSVPFVKDLNHAPLLQKQRWVGLYTHPILHPLLEGRNLKAEPGEGHWSLWWTSGVSHLGQISLAHNSLSRVYGQKKLQSIQFQEEVKIPADHTIQLGITQTDIQVCVIFKTPRVNLYVKKLKLRKGDLVQEYTVSSKLQLASSSLIAFSDQLSDHKIYHKM